MKNRVLQFIAALLLFASLDAKSQSVKENFANSGVWADYGVPVSSKDHPEFKGRLANINWSDIEIQPNVWDWTKFDDDINKHVADNMPVIFMVYTKENAPQWLFTNGVPKVNETNAGGTVTGYSPYYLDEDYNVYFKRMITKVREHVQTLPPAARNNIIGVQACFGSTGDQIAYKGAVTKQYEISEAQFDSLFKVYSLYYYNEYKNLTPKITMLSNGDNWNPEQQYWLHDNCPGGWIKCGSLGKGFQLNGELDKQDWLYDVLNKPQYGEYQRARSEIWAQQLDAGWWTKNEYKSMFALMTYLVYWGLDWHNETTDILQDPKHDSALSFFNKYAGQKVPAAATNAVCALKDVLDAADEVRFPAAAYGTVDRKNSGRYIKIYNEYAAYGAKLEEQAVMTGYEYDYLFGSNGTNDVGWRLLPGNYERYLHQIDANATSAGYWNIDDEHNDAMYGRFGRGFDLAKGKDALYFDVEDGFLRSAPVNAKYPVTIEVTYYDNGTGSWKLFYDAAANKNKASVSVTCGNTKTWKKKTIVLTDAYFGNRGTRGSDFYIKSANSSNVIFSVVELSRPEQSTVGFLTSPLAAFDTVCVNSAAPAPKSFVLNGGYLNGSDVQVGPLNGYTFSTTADGVYSNSLTFTGYGNQINTIVYVKLNTSAEGVFNGNIPVKGGGVTAASVSVKASVLNTSPVLNAGVVTISCYNKKDGSIDLQPAGGIGPFTYKWSNNVQQYWNAATEDLSGLQVADYTVTVGSSAGCSVTKTFSITQPDVLVVSVSQDSAIKCKGGSTTVKVTATGGTMPYTGVGTFTVASGFNTYTVTDARGCSAQKGYSVANGTLAVPATTPFISGLATVTKSQSGIVYTVSNPNSTCKYIWNVPADAVITAGQNTASVTVTWGASSGSITVQGQNECGSTVIGSKSVTVKNSFSQQTGSSMETTATISTSAATSKTTSRQMTVMPNPVRDIATLQFYANEKIAYTVQIADINGKVLVVRKGTAAAGSNTEKFDVQNLTKGYYFVTMINSQGEKQTVKMMKQ